MALTVGERLKALQPSYEQAMQTGDPVVLRGLIPQYAELLNTAPKEPLIIFTIGSIYLALGYNGMAINLFETCLRISPKAPEVWNNLGSAWKAELNNKEAERCYRQAVRLNPNYSDYYNNLATLHINEGSPEKGIDDANKAIELNPDNLRAHWNRSLLLLEMGMWEHGFTEYDFGLVSADRPNVQYVDTPFYEGERKPGDTLVVYGEQGLGDEVMWLSAMSDLIADWGIDNVVFDCHPRLQKVIERTFPGLETHPTRKKNRREWADGRTFDHKMALGSIFRWYRLHGNFPRCTYLTPDPEKVAKWRKKLEETGPGPYVGFGWAGGSKRTHGQARTFKLTPMLSILGQEATFVSLQYTKEAQEKLDRFKEDTGITIHHWPDAVTAFDYDETIALIAALDLCILPNTTAVHVAGAVGTQCLTLTPDRCAWRYSQGGDEMVFYGPWVRQVRENGNWGNAIQQVADDLKHFLEEFDEEGVVNG